MKVSTEDYAAPELEQYRNHLRLLGELQLSPRLRVKEGVSDIVQQTMLDAFRDLAGLRGDLQTEV